MPGAASKWLAAGFALALPGLAAAADAPVRPPNIVFILADDLGYNDVAFHGGNPGLKTPHLDGLAAAGARLDDFHAASSICRPSRASLLSGKNPLRVGFRDNNPGQQLPLDRTSTLPGLLRGAGYSTAHVGKWHVGGMRCSDLETRRSGSDAPHQPGPLEHGFDDYVSAAETRCQAGPFVGKMKLVWQGTLHSRGASLLVRNDEPLPPSDEHGYDAQVRQVLEFIDRYAEEGSPFFISFAMDYLHPPMEWPPEQWSRPYVQQLPKSGPARKSEARRARTLATLAHLDAGIGRILERLEKRGLLENTLVVFTSDNGAAGSGRNAPYRGVKGEPGEGGHRVPAVASWPARIPAGTRVEERTVMTDWLPTFADAAGVSLPEGEVFDGTSLLPRLVEQTALPERPIFLAGIGAADVHHTIGFKNRLREVLYRGRWKLVAANGRPLHLYDVVADPSEAKDVLAQHPERVAQMASELRRILRESSGAVSAGGAG